MDILYLFTFCLVINYSAGSLVDGIVTLSWSDFDRTQIIDRFLWNKTRIQLKINCRNPSGDSTQTKTLLDKNIQKSDKLVMGTMIKIRGRIGRVVDCFPLELESLIRNESPKKDISKMVTEFQNYYNQIWSRIEQKTFEAHQSDCDDMGTHLYVDQYSDLIVPENVKDTKTKSNNKYLLSNSNSENRRHRRDRRENSNQNDKSSNLFNGLGPDGGSFLTWADGYYLIELDVPEIVSSSKNDKIDVDIIISMKNYLDGYLTADEYPALIFYGVMCSIYALFALLWLYWCAIYWKQLLKIQFAIGAVILIGMIEKSAFIAEYDRLNKDGYAVYYAILFAEILSCLKRTFSRILVLTVALGYGIVKPRLGSLKRKIIVIAVIYFSLATIEAFVRIRTKLDEANKKVFISRIPLALVDSIIYYWIFTGLIATTRNLRLKQNSAKLNLYRHFTNVILFAIVMSLLFMIWSIKSHFFASCILQWRELWMDDAFWHVLFSVILLVIMFLFRPSNNNQRYVFVPLLDHSDNESQNDSNDEGQDESTLFDSVSMRKTMNVRTGLSGKNKGQEQVRSQHRENYTVANSADNGTVEDALNWVENNLPTSFADQALRALEQDDEIVDATLARSKMQ